MATLNNDYSIMSNDNARVREVPTKTYAWKPISSMDSRSVQRYIGGSLDNCCNTVVVANVCPHYLFGKPSIGWAFFLDLNALILLLWNSEGCPLPTRWAVIFRQTKCPHCRPEVQRNKLHLCLTSFLLASLLKTSCKFITSFFIYKI